MDGYRFISASTALLAVVMLSVVSDRAAAQQTRNSIDEYVGPAGYCDTCDIGCGAPVCGSGVGCSPCTAGAGGFYVGFEAVLVQPRFEDNVAFTVMNADGASFESFSDTQFDYDLEFTPRAFVGWEGNDRVGFRATWWQYDHEAAVAAANPPANGVGLITHPPFGDVDLSSEIPGNLFSASTDLDAYTIDLELTHSNGFGAWDVGVGGGFRYARVEQSYRARLQNGADALLGRIDFLHSLEGYGPTISLDAYRPIYSDAGVFCKARCSLLFGDGESRLVAQEDSDLQTPFDTTRTASRDDLLSIGEVQVGMRWQANARRGQLFRPFLSMAMEGQIWSGAGNAASENGALGFYGFNAGAGGAW